MNSVVCVFGTWYRIGGGPRRGARAEVGGLAAGRLRLLWGGWLDGGEGEGEGGGIWGTECPEEDDVLQK